MDFPLNDTTERITVFGYGSLTWKPGFEYTRWTIGYIKGYKRRFWQGNTTHRGTKDRVGRVATLIPDEHGVVWGVAYVICGREAVSKALAHLCVREMSLGGYSVITTTFRPRNSEFEPQSVIVYMATSQNDLFLGDQSIHTMATEIYMASGSAGSNSEYVTKLADFIRNHIPEEYDEHLFALDQKLRDLENNDEIQKLTDEETSDNSEEDELFIDQRQT